MPKINILGPDTVGVDMKSHPLSLGNKRLHSAVNLSFEEGVIRTRPGFRYHPLGISGRFQGACLFTPSLGISAQPFAQALAGLVTVVNGKVFVNDTTWGNISCNPIEVTLESALDAASPVNVFGAENWLIIQNIRSNTHWWSGSGVAQASPGMNEDSYWTDPEPPAVCFTPPAYAADIPDCDRFPCDPDPGCTIILESKTVVNTTTATFVLRNTGTTAATVTGFVTDPPGLAEFTPSTLVVPAGASRAFTVVVTGFDLETQTLGVTVENSCGSGEFEFSITPPSLGCQLEVISMVTTSPTVMKLALQNTGSLQVSDIYIYPMEDAVNWDYSPAPPWVLESGEVINITVNGVGSPVTGIAFNVQSNCAPIIDPPPVVPPVVSGSCALGIESFSPNTAESGGFTLVNLGGVPITVTSLGGSDFIFVPSAPISLDPGIAQYVVAISPGSQILLSPVLISNSCSGDIEYQINE